MAPTLYMTPASPPVRAVLMTAKYLNLELEYKIINPRAGDHLKPEYLKINPQHTIPTLKDEDGFILWESHAIMPYLIEKYGKGDDSLYPTKDYKKRAVINQRLHFDTGVFFPRLMKVIVPVFFRKEQPNPADLESFYEAIGFLETFLKNNDYVAGDSLSIADLSLIACVSSEQMLGIVDYAKYPRIQAWIKRMEAVPCYAANKEGLDGIRKAIEEEQKK